jgi:hypothetical protein
MKSLFLPRVAGTLLAFSLFAGSAFAQTVSNAEFNASAEIPAGWQQGESNDRAAFFFRHEESHSQIEVIATELMTPEVADTFFETFHETLTSSEFSVIGSEPRTIGAHSGLETIYSFTHSGVTLKVAVFQFVQDSNAWLIVGYMPADEYDAHAPAYQSVVASISING